MPIEPRDLEPVEIALLGVLCCGLPPSRAAGSDTFRVDHVTAVVTGLYETADREQHLDGAGPAIAADFRSRLQAAVLSLTEKGILEEQPGDMPAAPGGFEAGLAIDMVNPDVHPAVMDRYLAQQCMEVLFNVPEVYPYLMERYAAAGEVWRRLRAGGYATD